VSKVQTDPRHVLYERSGGPPTDRTTGEYQTPKPMIRNIKQTAHAHTVQFASNNSQHPNRTGRSRDTCICRNPLHHSLLILERIMVRAALYMHGFRLEIVQSRDSRPSRKL
jgi:hypothetical protein